MSNQVPDQDRTWGEGDEAVARMQAGLRQARRVVEAAKSNLIEATDVVRAPEKAHEG